MVLGCIVEDEVRSQDSRTDYVEALEAKYFIISNLGYDSNFHFVNSPLFD